MYVPTARKRWNTTTYATSNALIVGCISPLRMKIMKILMRKN